MPACKKPFEDHDEYVNHITNIHPPHKPCPKCQNIMYWAHHKAPTFWTVSYICSDCGFIGESWELWDGWNDYYVKKRKWMSFQKYESPRIG